MTDFTIGPQIDLDGNNSCRIVSWPDGSCRPAHETEIALWAENEALRAELEAVKAELARLKDRVARLEKLERKNLSTIHVTRWRLNEYGKSTAELDEAIRETEAFLALTTDSPGGAAALVTANNGGSDAG